ncbi:hypothetical protein BGZ57DRAFT_761652 [Hyaloscypha finlandica]|nr:hypothetical protein BGZ57DRAFT_761652 [Hyaloscypha finlandica]
MNLTLCSLYTSLIYSLSYYLLSTTSHKTYTKIDIDDTLIYFAVNYSRQEVYSNRIEDRREDINALLTYLTEELETRDNEPYKIASIVANIIYKKFIRNGIKEQINIAISFAHISLYYKYNNPEITNRLLSNLGVFLGSRYKRTGDINDLEEAIQVARQVVASTPKYYSDLVGFLNSFRNRLRSWYKRTGDITNLEEAI